jgi:hypothetical protein
MLQPSPVPWSARHSLASVASSTFFTHLLVAGGEKPRGRVRGITGARKSVERDAHVCLDILDQRLWVLSANNKQHVTCTVFY